MTARVVRLAHSPDSDDAFMFYALAEGKVDTEGVQYVHELQDIETLNQRARRAELDVTAVSIHAYAYLIDSYALLPHGAFNGRPIRTAARRAGAPAPSRCAGTADRDPWPADDRVSGAVAV